MIASNSNALTEVYFVLCNLNKDEYNKIPLEIIKSIKKNMNIDYRININTDFKFIEQSFLPETKAILFNLYRDYLATTEQRDKVYKIQNKEREKRELYKSEKYNPNNIFKKSNIFQEEKIKKEEIGLIEIKKENKLITFFRKILKLIK